MSTWAATARLTVICSFFQVTHFGATRVCAERVVTDVSLYDLDTELDDDLVPFAFGGSPVAANVSQVRDSGVDALSYSNMALVGQELQRSDEVLTRSLQHSVEGAVAALEENTKYATKAKQLADTSLEMLKIGHEQSRSIKEMHLLNSGKMLGILHGSEDNATLS